MGNIVFFFFEYMVIFYTAFVVLSYLIMIFLSSREVKRHAVNSIDEREKRLLSKSPFTPGVSIVAPAYNEEVNIVDNVNSFLKQDYPKFEVIIVNDGSKDHTLEKLIENFDLVEVPYAYTEIIYTKPFKRLFRSINPKYDNLYVVDKENGGTKADAVNAGLNVAHYEWLVNTDVDCILPYDAIFQCVKMVLRHNNLLAVSGAMTMSNGCKVMSGELASRRAPISPIPLFQTLEYMRSFFLGKMAWSSINAMPNVSGGFGFLNRDLIMKAGGYAGDSFAEDMEVLLTTERYCCNFNIPFRVVQIPVNTCWTEGPSTLKILYRQRSRWGRGLLQTLVNNHDMIGRMRFRRTGLITLTYITIFEFLAPIIEASGVLITIYFIISGRLNIKTAIITFFAIMSFGLLVNTVVMLHDYLCGSSFEKRRDYILLLIAAVLEPIIYHPIVVVSSLSGYFKYIMNTKSVWGTMIRKKYAQAESDAQTAPTT